MNKQTNNQISQENIDEKQASTAYLISNIFRNKNGYYVIIYIIICQEDKMILNLGVLNNNNFKIHNFKIDGFSIHNYSGRFLTHYSQY